MSIQHNSLIAALMALACFACSKSGEEVDAGSADMSSVDADSLADGSAADSAPPDSDPPDSGAPPPGADAAGLSDAGMARPAQRTPIWVCNARFGEADADSPSANILARLDAGPEILRLVPTGEPCMFRLEYVDAAGVAIPLGDPGAYLAGQMVRDGQRTAACVTSISHEAAPMADGADPDGVMLRRRTTGVSAMCAVREAEAWSEFFAVQPETLAFAAWVTDLAVTPDGGYRLSYLRDSTLNPFNITADGRPPEDGLYDLVFRRDGAGQLQLGDAVRMDGLTTISLGAPPDPCLEDDRDPNDPRCEPRCGDGRCDPLETCGGDADEAPACRTDCGPCSLIIDDAERPEYRELMGEWGTARGRDDFSRFSDDGVAVFDVKGLKSGWKSLAVHHPRLPNSAHRAIYTIRTGDTVVGQVGDDQRTPREDWHPIGQFWTDGDFSVVVSKAGEGRLRTDAIRVEAQPEPPLEIDDGSFSYGELMGEWSTGVGGVGNQHRQAVGGQALYRLRVPPGTYALSAFLPRTEGGGPVTYALSAQGVSLGEFVVNQARGEDDWLAMGQYVFQNGPVHLSVEGVDGGPVIADAIRLTPVAQPEAISELTVEVTSPFYRETGAWEDLDGGRVTREPDGRAEYAFTGLTTGRYHLVAQYPPAANNTEGAQYNAFSGDAPAVRHSVDQRTPYEGPWRLIGDVFAQGPVVTIGLVGGQPDGALVAGALKLISPSCVECEGHPNP